MKNDEIRKLRKENIDKIKYKIVYLSLFSENDFYYH